ncbi:hypothetical protein XI07_15770 [Bradyrhizobium sp. CCBAU 11445]|nr:hypothetical protein [Bradyrhizobium sp. CCBAU 11445]
MHRHIHIFAQPYITRSFSMKRRVGFTSMLKLSLSAAFVLAAQAAPAQMVLDSDPAPGTLRYRQIVYVRCGPGKARIVTGATT